MTMCMADVLEQLGDRQDLTPEMAEFGFQQLMDGELSPAQAGAFLLGLRSKGEIALEVTAAVQTALARARLVPGLTGTRLEVVGTGGDNSHSFNCSTATALTLAGMGYTVSKHGNRAISGTCGSADAVEALGLPAPSEPEQAAAEMKKRGFAFLFAPHYHPAFKHIMPIRKELGVRTLFNIMGPLLNPARPTHLLVGAARPQFLHLMAEVLSLTGVKKAAVVHGAGGFDELTPFGPASVVWVSGKNLVATELDPEELGFKLHNPDDVRVKDKDEAIDVLRELLAGKGPEAMRDMLALNVAVALHLAEEGMGMAECTDRARAAVTAGVGRKVLDAG